MVSWRTGDIGGQGSGSGHEGIGHLSGQHGGGSGMIMPSARAFHLIKNKKDNVTPIIVNDFIRFIAASHKGKKFHQAITDNYKLIHQLNWSK